MLSNNKMKYVTVIVPLLAVLVLPELEAKRYTRCGLVHALRDYGFPEGKMRNWVCLVEHESSRRTDAVSIPGKAGYRSWGLFQINDKWWCSNSSTPGKECHVACKELITDDITKSCICAKKIYKIQGFNAWEGWKHHCQGALPDISPC